MKKRMLFLVVVIMALVFQSAPISSRAASPVCGPATGAGDMPSFGSVEVPFDCTAPATVFFGVCDNGQVPNDDVFHVLFGGNLVAWNEYVGSDEFAHVGSASVTAGSQVATIENLQDLVPVATYGYAISSDESDVFSYLSTWCGTDFGGISATNGCYTSIPVFTTDTAPTAGELRFNVQFGEKNREEGWTLKSWTVKAGQRINNDLVSAPGKHWARLWWKPDGGSTWYLLPSQYWMDGKSTASEYGYQCSLDAPSYHTSFSKAIAESKVPLFTGK